ncbi:D-alanine--D-alanine ligase [Sneathiella chungangensis]|uniref:D-alanine--D-alanine ligase n=1 Tax=Sneathiella chungangensis TaxID=1418234 RepID=A0A845MCQ4_9PROT|nr:D-alanine--D-alanine ligase [Sneathiella chungangensis]MZR21758.1 D-alanine--D-alanine ligase [Sneathiella chungangensis]
MTDYIPVLHGGTDLRADELDTIESAKHIASALERLGYRSEVIALDIDFTVVETIAQAKSLVVFNLVESIRGDGRLGHLACAFLEHFGLAYTGVGESAFFQSNSKRLSKALLRAANLPTPREWTDVAAAGQKVIIKSVNEHASYGMDQNSIVEGSEALNEIARREKEYGGRFFAEAYIPGREFNISMVETKRGPMVLPIAEMRFDGLPEGTYPIVDYNAKWNEESDIYHHTRRSFGLEAQEPDLASELVRICNDCWVAADLSGYARIDFRVDPAGRIYILEYNANPCLAPNAGFAAALGEADMRYEDGIRMIVDAALAKEAN